MLAQLEAKKNRCVGKLPPSQEDSQSNTEEADDESNTEEADDVAGDHEAETSDNEDTFVYPESPIPLN